MVSTFTRPSNAPLGHTTLRREREEARYAAADDGEGVGVGGIKKGAEKHNVAETAAAKVRLYFFPLSLLPYHARHETSIKDERHTRAFVFLFLFFGSLSLRFFLWDGKT